MKVSITLKDLEPLSNTEKEMILKLESEDEMISAILNRRIFLKDNSEYIGSLCKEHYKGRYQCRNEKDVATMPILYEGDV